MSTNTNSETINEKVELELTLSRKVVAGEGIMVLFPFFVLLLLIIAGYKDGMSFFYTSDWSLAGSLVAGQTIIRYTSAMSKASGKTYWQSVSLRQTWLFVVAALNLIIFGIYNSHDEPTKYLVIIQMLFFLVALFMFYKVSTASQWFLDSSEEES